MGFEIQHLTSRANPVVMQAYRLHEKKYRAEQGRFFFEGEKLLCEALDAACPLVAVFTTEAAALHCDALLQRLPQGVRRYTVTDAVYEKLTVEQAPQGIFTVCASLDKTVKSATMYENGDAGETLFLCHGLQDPGNVGTVIRTAAALGIGRLIVSADTVDLYHPRTVRGAMGALFRQRVDRTDDMASYIRSLQACGRRVCAAALHRDATVLGQGAKDTGASYLVGNEGHGLPDSLIDLCDGCVRIPMAPHSESFNASIAAALLMWETARGSAALQ